MKMKFLVSLMAALVMLAMLVPASPVLAAPVPLISLDYIFDFDTGSPAVPTGTSTPFNQTFSGLTAHFGSPSDPAAFSLQTGETTFLTLSQFSGKFLYQNGITPTSLKIGFSQPLTSITLTFVTADYFGEVDQPTLMRLTAYVGSTENATVGTATARGTFSGDSFPQGTLSFTTAGQAFSWVKLEMQLQTKGGTVFFVDNIVASASSVTINKGDTFTASGSFSDTGFGPWTATVDYGDGSGVQPLVLSDMTFSLSHVYSDNGTFTANVTVTDDLSASGSDTVLVTVTSLESYQEAGRINILNTFDATNNTVYMKGTGFSSRTYNVAYYDAGASGGQKVVTDAIISVAGDGIFQSQITLNNYLSSTPGTWHAIVQPTGSTAFPNGYNTAMTSPTTYQIIANDSFTVTPSAVPELPTTISAIVVTGLCLGIYFWMRKRRLAYANA